MLSYSVFFQSVLIVNLIPDENLKNLNKSKTVQVQCTNLFVLMHHNSVFTFNLTWEGGLGGGIFFSVSFCFLVKPCQSLTLQNFWNIFCSAKDQQHFGFLNPDTQKYANPRIRNPDIRQQKPARNKKLFALNI